MPTSHVGERGGDDRNRRDDPQMKRSEEMKVGRHSDKPLTAEYAKFAEKAEKGKWNYMEAGSHRGLGENKRAFNGIKVLSAIIIFYTTQPNPSLEKPLPGTSYL